MIKYKLVPYKDADYQFVYDIKKLCFEKYVEEYYGGWDEQQQIKFFNDFIKTYKNNLVIITANNIKIGVFGDEYTDKKIYHPFLLCLLPEYRGQGIGSAILKDKMEKNKDKEIHLKVFKSNPARFLYERLGFEIISETKSHYIMVKNKK